MWHDMRGQAGRSVWLSENITDCVVQYIYSTSHGVKVQKSTITALMGGWQAG